MLRNEIVIRKEFIIPANLNALLAIIVTLSKGNVKKVAVLGCRDLKWRKSLDLA